MKQTLKTLIFEVLKESIEKSWKEMSQKEKLAKVHSALGKKLPKDLSDEEMEKLGSKIGKEVSGQAFSATTLRRYIRDIRERPINEEQIRNGDVEGLVNWLDRPENWTAAANAVSLSGAGEEKNLIDFIKAHREFSDWSWGDVEHAIRVADERDLMESFQKVKLFTEMKKTISDAFDRGDWDLFNTAKSEDAIKSVKDKIDATKNPQLIRMFDRMAAVEKYRKVLAQYPQIFAKNIDTAAKSGNWAGLENWLMDLVKKINDPTQINEFFLRSKK